MEGDNFFLEFQNVSLFTEKERENQFQFPSLSLSRGGIQQRCVRREKLSLRKTVMRGFPPRAWAAMEKVSFTGILKKNIYRGFRGGGQVNARCINYRL